MAANRGDEDRGAGAAGAGGRPRVEPAPAAGGGARRASADGADTSGAGAHFEDAGPVSAVAAGVAKAGASGADDARRSATSGGPQPAGRAAWRVLLIDDSRDDAELAELALRDGGLAVECRRVYTEQALREALPEFEPDLVLSDVNIPGFDGTEAQAVVRELRPSLPFVFLTGSLYVPDPAPPGADALLLKDDLASLPGLLRRLLGE